MTALNRTQIQQAIAHISTQGALFGEATTATVLDVLRERLGDLGEETRPEKGAVLAREQRKQVTILFAAIDGFTRLTDTARNTKQIETIAPKIEGLSEDMAELKTDVRWMRESMERQHE